jgi:hypothetical protein
VLSAAHSGTLFSVRSRFKRCHHACRALHGGSVCASCDFVESYYMSSVAFGWFNFVPRARRAKMKPPFAPPDTARQAETVDDYPTSPQLTQTEVASDLESSAQRPGVANAPMARDVAGDSRAVGDELQQLTHLTSVRDTSLFGALRPYDCAQLKGGFNFGPEDPRLISLSSADGSERKRHYLLFHARAHFRTAGARTWNRSLALLLALPNHSSAERISGDAPRLAHAPRSCTMTAH